MTAAADAVDGDVHGSNAATGTGNAKANRGRFAAGPDPRRNAGGRPPGPSMAERLREWGELTIPQLRYRLTGPGRKVQPISALDEQAIRALLQGATPKGERDRIHNFNRLDGMPVASVKMDSTADDKMARTLERLGAVIERANGEDDEPAATGTDEQQEDE